MRGGRRRKNDEIHLFCSTQQCQHLWFRKVDAVSHAVGMEGPRYNRSTYRMRLRDRPVCVVKCVYLPSFFSSLGRAPRPLYASHSEQFLELSGSGQTPTKSPPAKFLFAFPLTRGPSEKVCSLIIVSNTPLSATLVRGSAVAIQVTSALCRLSWRLATDSLGVGPPRGRAQVCGVSVSARRRRCGVLARPVPVRPCEN